jgi:ABC-type Fe3+/spermidine/putrescine transport system ATPase subunit
MIHAPPRWTGRYVSRCVVMQLRRANDGQTRPDRIGASLSLGIVSWSATARCARTGALSRPASLLLLDEPFSAFDAPLRSRLRREFHELQQELDATTILVTHDPAEPVLLADDLLLLDAGRVLQSGPVASVFLRPANETVARLLGAEIIGYGRP